MEPFTGLLFIQKVLGQSHCNTLTHNYCSRSTSTHQQEDGSKFLCACLVRFSCPSLQLSQEQPAPEPAVLKQGVTTVGRFLE